MTLIEVWGTHPPDDPENIEWVDNVDLANFRATMLGHAVTCIYEVGEPGKVPKTILRQIAERAGKGTDEIQQ